MGGDAEGVTGEETSGIGPARATAPAHYDLPGCARAFVTGVTEEDP